MSHCVARSFSRDEVCEEVKLAFQIGFQQRIQAGYTSTCMGILEIYGNTSFLFLCTAPDHMVVLVYHKYRICFATIPPLSYTVEYHENQDEYFKLSPNWPLFFTAKNVSHKDVYIP